jgi:hypothetical protein
MLCEYYIPSLYGERYVVIGTTEEYVIEGLIVYLGVGGILLTGKGVVDLYQAFLLAEIISENVTFVLPLAVSVFYWHANSLLLSRGHLSTLAEHLPVRQQLAPLIAAVAIR